MSKTYMIGASATGRYLPVRLEQIIANPMDAESRKEFHKPPKIDLNIIKR